MRHLVLLGTLALEACSPSPPGDSGSAHHCFATGFASTPQQWSTPVRGDPSDPAVWNGPGISSYTCVSGDHGNLDWNLLDLLGSGHPSIVVFEDSCDPPLGTDHWDVYVAGDTGFAPTPTQWKVPNRPQSCLQWSPPTVWAPQYNVNGNWYVLDVNGDGIDDLLVVKDPCDPSISFDHWDLYPGTPTGFSADPVRLSLPQLGTTDLPFQWTWGGTWHGCAGGGRGHGYWALVDLTGDHRLDLVLQGDECDWQASTDHWLVYPGTASGFDGPPIEWKLPQVGSPAQPVHWVYRTPTHGCADGRTATLGWRLLALDSMHPPSIVVQSDECDPSISLDHWDVYPVTPTGFRQVPYRWTLPPPSGPNDPMRWGIDPMSDHSCPDGQVGFMGWELFDITHNGHLDLIVSTDACDPRIAYDYWDVYKGSPMGAAATPTHWSLPLRGDPGNPMVWQTPVVSGTDYTCTSGSLGTYAASSVPLTPDGRLDLTVYSDSCDNTIPYDHWDIYPTVCN